MFGQRRTKPAPPVQSAQPSGESHDLSVEILSAAYAQILRRVPDSDARQWLADRLAQGQTGLSLLSDILASAAPEEPESTISDPQALDADMAILAKVHQRFLGRLPDEAASDWLRGRLQAGQSGLSLVADLMTSPEYEEWSRHLLFVPPGHFYSPITTAPEVEAALTLAAAHSTQTSLPGINIDRAAMLALWHAIGSLPRAEHGSGRRYHPDNPHFSAPDAFVWEGMLRLLLPHRVIEVGSGWSSALLLDTIDAHFPHKVQLTFVEPYPALLRSRLGEARDVTIIETGVQAADPALFDTLEAGDILFIDSTHIVKTGSDVVHELFEVLPRLKSGVYVHFHDVFWPFEYSRHWTLVENRSWNELYVLRAFLTDNPAWEIVMLNDYLAKTAADEVRQHFPAFSGGLGGSLYLRKR
jgi:hypothetical protein